MELLTRTATFEPATFDAERNTVKVTFSAGADVVRRDYQGPYTERFSMNPSDWDLSELPGAPVLDNHDRYSGVRAILGVVEGGEVKNREAGATVRFGQRDDIKGIVTDVRGGVIRNVSFGYEVREWREATENNMRVRTAFGIKPKEISLTALAADAGAKIRTAPGEQMNPQEQYRSIAEAVGVPIAFADDLATRAVPETDARTAIIREAARLIPPIDTRQPAHITRDGQDGLVERMADGLLTRINPAHKPEAGREFVNFRWADVARRILETRSLSTLGSPVELITRAMHTTSDFSNILAELFNKELLRFRLAPAPVEQLFKRATVDDFRARHVLEISDGPALEKVNQSGEVKGGSIEEKKLSSYITDSYGRRFAISFQTLVNDDMGALSDLSTKMTAGARRWFASLLVDAIIANPALADNKAVFHADHGNLAGSGAVPGESTIGAGKLAMRLQTDLSGNPIDAAPKFILIPATLEAAVDRLLATLYPAQSADAEVASRNLTPVVDPRFDIKGETTAWYLFADPQLAPVFEYSELSGYEGPRVEARQGFETLGSEIRVLWHLGVGAVDSRGAWKNDGQ